MSEGTHHIHIQINLDFPRAALQQSIQRIIYLVSGALNSCVAISDSELRLPGTNIETVFDPTLIWSSTEVRGRLKEWILQNGFRDGVESLTRFLESVHSICSVWALILRQNHGEVLTGADWQQLNDTEPKRFHKLGFPDKLRHLREAHRIDIDPIMLKHVHSANSARNCLVHRNGVVTNRDAEDGRLVVSWRRMKSVAIDENGERDLLTGAVYAGGTKIEFRSVDEEKVFNIGDSISFSPQEFQNISWSMFLFADHLSISLSKWGTEHGFATSPSPSA